MISPPSTITGPSKGEVGKKLVFSIGEAKSNLEHSLEYRFDWGDGSYSAWVSSAKASHSWSDPETYTIRAQARCAIHTDTYSDWSPKLMLNITSVDRQR